MEEVLGDGSEKLRCTRCEKDLPTAAFHRDRTKPTGYRGDCKKCRGETRAGIRRASSETISSPEQPVSSNPEQRLRAEAQRGALRTLVANHPREFRQLVVAQLRDMSAPLRWRSIGQSESE
jgi:hypothetical protein